MKISHSLIFVIAIILATLDATGQMNTPPVHASGAGRGTYANPWAGGMNACQFGQLDMDLDGTKDLVVFDRCGNRLMPFIAAGSAGNPDYTFAPEFVDGFPELSDWAIFEDYNGDGREDIFTYSPGYAGLKVYRNISGSQLEFTLEVFPYLTSFQGGGYVNILVTYADYPAIADLDGDGDLDMLTFYGLGSFVEMHRNMSVEKYGTVDSLDFIKTESCWGYFAESEESNEVTLDTCGPSFVGMTSDTEGIRHTGSTFRVLDLNGDGLPDLLLGDVDYPNLVALFNGGNADTARMTSFDWEFPAYNVPVNQYSMPASFSLDIDQDGARDLVASPFDPNPYICDNINSSWYYRNQGDDLEPQFELAGKRFLQEDMIDLGAGAYPVFADYNNDGLMDLFVGNYGRYDTAYLDQSLILQSEHTGQIALFINTGSANQPAFTYFSEDFASVGQLDILGAVPAFADLDGDDDPDMLVGNDAGQIIFYENTAPEGQPMEMILRDQQYQGIDVGHFSAPALFDLDQDGLTDLVVGEKGGNLNFYRNTGTAGNPLYEMVTDSLGKVNVTFPNVSLDGFSFPFLLQDNQGHVQLLVGSEQGKLFYYAGIEDDLNGEFKESGELAALIGVPGFHADRGFRTGAALADLSGDGVPELVAGNFSGGLEYFSSGGHPAVSGVDECPDFDDLFRIYPNPAEEYLIVECTNPDLYRINSISLYDISGRVIRVQKKADEDLRVLNVSDLSAGLYFICISFSENRSDGSFNILKKVLKKTKSK
jgi:hypothetical protein